MDEVSSVVVPRHGNSNLSANKDWLWDQIDEEEPTSSFAAALPLDGSEGGLFSGNFVPPPPRPSFLDEGVTPDGLTTCDLCSWAWQNGNAYTIDANLEAPHELGWVLTLVIVSLISAIIGAIVMIIVLHCKRLKSTNAINEQDRRTSSRPPISTPDIKTISSSFPADGGGGGTHHPSHPSHPQHSSVWSWLSSRRSAASLDQPPSTFAENHYTHMEDGYSSPVMSPTPTDALYAELESSADRDSPAYQNSAYTDPEGAPTSSAPSSAYYSDLSIGPHERPYEVVGLVTMPCWDGAQQQERNKQMRLASISENVPVVPSDYV